MLQRRLLEELTAEARRGITGERSLVHVRAPPACLCLPVALRDASKAPESLPVTVAVEIALWDRSVERRAYPAFGAGDWHGTAS
eukprot:1341505-Rhodomonas_salina.1